MNLPETTALPPPEIRLSPAPAGWDPFADPSPWSQATHLPPLVPADGRGPAAHQTQVALCYDRRCLYVRFQCADPDIWGTYTRRDDPIYEEEVVELFLAPGSATPARYVELEISPNGVLFDAWVHNPTGERSQMEVDTAWNCPGIRWHVERDDGNSRWQAVLALPWAPFLQDGDSALPERWRANFYRIERPRGQEPEFSCWSPTLTDPADFHRPERFGHLVLGAA